MTDNELRAVLAERLAEVRLRIAAACARVGRNPEGVTLVAVTKTVSPRVARLIAELGVLDLGESRPQELWRKADTLKDLPIRWHLVGHLQRNKAERTLRLAHMIHSVDSLRLYESIQAEAARQRRHRPEILLQVNISREGQKHGFDYEELRREEAKFETTLTDASQELPPLLVVGLMGMAAYSDDPESARPAFRELHLIRHRLSEEWLIVGPQLEHLSMGMSGDFEVAIEEGATIVRIGTTLFEGLENE
jgi:pyridoxal phosphate enzyme (YggS family)